MGQNELRCAFCCDPSGFFVGELDGKKISYISVVKYDCFAIGSYFMVEDAYVGRGYARQMWRATGASLDEDFNVMGFSCLQDMVGVCEKKGFQKAWVDCECVVSASNTIEVLSDSMQLSPFATIKPIKFDDLFAYDTDVFGAPRQKY